MPNPRTTAARRSQLKSGYVVRDTYTVLGFLGRGRFGDAYRVRHRYMGIQAMKVLVDTMDGSERDACFTEAFLLSKLSYPGIVRVFDANNLDEDVGGFPYITMEFMAGGTLEELLSEATNGLILDVALEIAVQAARALGHAHRLDPPLVHRDVKPANILLEDNDSRIPGVRLADYGLAAHTNLFTRTVEAGGTILYMSPESLRGFETPASDVYSLGLVMYELLTGTLPYPKQAFADLETPEQFQKTLAEMHKQPISPPSYFDPKIPADVDAVVLRALGIEELQRFQSGDALAAAIQACRTAHTDASETALTPEVDQELRSIFSLAYESGSLKPACRRLDHLIRSNPLLKHHWQPHLDWMRHECKPDRQSPETTAHA